MTKLEVFARVQTAIMDHTSLDESKVTPMAALAELLPEESDPIWVAINIDNDLGTDLDMGRAEVCKTVQDLADLACRELGIE